MVANAVRRIALGELTGSGRFYADLDELTADGRAGAAARRAAGSTTSRTPAPASAMPAASDRTDAELRFIVACASSAPSGGNMQPWRFEARRERRPRARVDPAATRRCWTSATAPRCFALGAALEAAIDRRARARLRPVVRRAADGPGVGARARRRDGSRDEHAAEVLWQRCCNRRTGASPPVGDRELRARVVRRAARHARPRPASAADARRRARRASTASASSRRGCART